MGKKFQGRSLLICFQWLHDVRIAIIAGFFGLTLKFIVSWLQEGWCISKHHIQFRTRRKREELRIIPAALFLQLGQQNFPRNWQADLYLYLINETCVTRPPDPKKAKIIETWLSLLIKDSHDPLYGARHVATPSTVRIWYPGRRKTVNIQ